MKNLTVIKAALSVAVLFLAAGCAKGKGANLYSPPPVINENTATGSGIKVEFNPKLDVLFVVDNSESMSKGQDRLRAAISKFVDAFGENSFIDYRVGVISVYDGRRCGKPNKFNNYQTMKCYPEGQLQPVRDAQGQVIANASYVQRGEGASEVLKSTLVIGALKLEDDGPQFEEMFSPVLAAVSPHTNNGVNHGFIRPDSHVVIVFVSDEDDSSIEYTPDAFINALTSMIPPERLSLYGVLATTCARASFAKAPDRLVSAIQTLRGKTYPICDLNFGASLANMGSRIRNKLYRINPISLPTVAEQGTLKLYYGSTEIPMGQGSWVHDLKFNQIVIDSDLNVPYVEGQVFRAAYREVSAQAIRKGRVKRTVY